MTYTEDNLIMISALQHFAFCERQCALIPISEHGRFLARVQGPVSGNVLLRRQQYRWADDEGQSARMAGSILVGKVANCRSVLGRMLRRSRALGLFSRPADQRD